MARRPTITILAIAISTIFLIFLLLGSGGNPVSKFSSPDGFSKQAASVEDIRITGEPSQHSVINNEYRNNMIINGKPIMSKMTNQTVRAELGRSAWKVFHTILAQYPEKPTPEERETLASYIHLFSRVYPCRECAEHFQVLLKKYPPQTSSREHATQWGCHVHNQVNVRLQKDIFDCNDLSDKYACGCSEDGEEKGEKGEKDDKANDLPPLERGG